MQYDDAGQGIPLLLVHGFPLDRSLWRAQVEGLQDAARVIAPDLRGFGGTDAGPKTTTMDDHVADLVTLIRTLDLERVVLCGLSMGGYIALAFLARHPEMVRGLILCNTRAGADDEKAREGRQAAAKKVSDEGIVPFAEGMLPKLLTGATIAARPDVSASVKAMIVRQRPTGVIAALRGIAARPDHTSLLARIGVPTLIITGSADTLIPPSESEAMAAAIPDSTLVVIPNVAHLSNVEDPEAFNRAVREFLKTIKP